MTSSAPDQIPSPENMAHVPAESVHQKSHSMHIWHGLGRPLYANAMLQGVLSQNVCLEGLVFHREVVPISARVGRSETGMGNGAVEEDSAAFTILMMTLEPCQGVGVSGT